jgi:hypothetical protein
MINKYISHINLSKTSSIILSVSFNNYIYYSSNLNSLINYLISAANYYPFNITT